MSNGLNAYTKQSRSKAVTVVKDKRRHARSSLGESTQAPAPRVANTLTRIEGAVANNSPELGVTACSINNAAVAKIEFPLCDAAVRKMNSDEWELAAAIVAECSETGDAGVRNASYAKMEAMQQEIAKNHGVELSVERIRKLRKVASAFPAGRRRPDVSIEGHLEAGTPEALDELAKAAPAGTVLTRDYIRLQKHPDRNAKQDQRKAERQRQKEEQRTALQNLCRQAERDKEQLLREKEARERQYVELCRNTGKEPEPVSPALAPDDEPSLPTAEKLEQELRLWLAARRFDPAAGDIKQAITDFVKAVLAQQQ